MSKRYDLVVIGSGPAGEKGAAQAAYFGKSVALIERSSHLGGTGINTGTIPSKTLRETALYFPGCGSAACTGSTIPSRNASPLRTSGTAVASAPRAASVRVWQVMSR